MGSKFGLQRWNVVLPELRLGTSPNPGVRQGLSTEFGSLASELQATDGLDRKNSDAFYGKSRQSPERYFLGYSKRSRLVPKDKDAPDNVKSIIVAVNRMSRRTAVAVSNLSVAEGLPYIKDEGRFLSLMILAAARSVELVKIRNEMLKGYVPNVNDKTIPYAQQRMFLDSVATYLQTLEALGLNNIHSDRFRGQLDGILPQLTEQSDRATLEAKESILAHNNRRVFC